MSLPPDVADWIVSPDPTPRSGVKHIERRDHPSNTYPRTRLTECGRYVPVREMADHVDQVSCPACRVVLNAREAVQI